MTKDVLHFDNEMHDMLQASSLLYIDNHPL